MKVLVCFNKPNSEIQPLISVKGERYRSYENNHPVPYYDLNTTIKGGYNRIFFIILSQVPFCIIYGEKIKQSKRIVRTLKRPKTRKQRFQVNLRLKICHHSLAWQLFFQLLLIANHCSLYAAEKKVINDLVGAKVHSMIAAFKPIQLIALLVKAH